MRSRAPCVCVQVRESGHFKDRDGALDVVSGGASCASPMPSLTWSAAQLGSLSSRRPLRRPFALVGLLLLLLGLSVGRWSRGVSGRVSLALSHHTRRQVWSTFKEDGRPQPLPKSTVTQLGLEGDVGVRSLQV